MAEKHLKTFRISDFKSSQTRFSEWAFFRGSKIPKMIRKTIDINRGWAFIGEWTFNRTFMVYSIACIQRPLKGSNESGLL